MSADVAAPEAPPKASKKPLLIGLVLMLLLGGGAFYAVWSGRILGGAHEEAPAAEAADALPVIGFVPLEPIVISLGNGAARHLRFTAQVEVEAGHEAEVEHLKPRIMDVINGYLRAVDNEDLEAPTAIIRIRSQLLRRIQMVVGEGRVRDLLIIEFVLN